MCERKKYVKKRQKQKQRQRRERHKDRYTKTERVVYLRGERDDAFGWNDSNLFTL